MQKITAIKATTFVVCLIPFIILSLATFELLGQSLGANPIEKMMDELGIWGLRFILITLSITPLRKIGAPLMLIKLRRMLGLFAFFYIFMHFLTYAILDQGLSWRIILEDILERPYITLGVSAFLLLIPLAVTSTNKWMKKLGKKWKKLHRLIYPIAILGVWHFFWQVKLNTREPLIYATILLVLLALRLDFISRHLKKIPRRSKASNIS